MASRKQMDQVRVLESHGEARREDRDLNSFDYAEDAIKRGGLTGLLGVFGFLLGHAVNPELTWLFLLPAAGTAAIALQSFRLTYLNRLDRRKVKGALERRASIDATPDRTDFSQLSPGRSELE